MENRYKVIASAILAIGITLSGLCCGYFYYKSKIQSNFVTVKGLAEMDVKADLGVWNIKYVVVGNDLTQAQIKLENQKKIIIDFLKDKGFTDEEISIKRTEINDIMANPYRNNSAETERYILTRGIQVTSSNVNLVDKTISKTNELIAQGIVFNNDYVPVSYIYTKINDIKPQMLRKATQNAEIAAVEFAKSSGSRVGKIHKANQGVFSILPRYRTFDTNELGSIDKKIRVVSTVEYYLE